jgi:hypothetical protein
MFVVIRLLWYASGAFLFVTLTPFWAFMVLSFIYLFFT